MTRRVSVQPEWALALNVQQQSVLFLAARGPDGIGKDHPCKDVVRAYRGTVLVAAKYGRLLEWGERSVGDTFMSLDLLASPIAWKEVTRQFFETADALPWHYRTHLLHGTQILGYKHPDERFRERWYGFYLACVDDLHLRPESEFDMDARLGDWDRAHWLDPDEDLGS